MSDTKTPSGTAKLVYTLSLSVNGSQPVPVTLERTLTLGRESNVSVDVDLTNWGAYRMGVSRKHLRFDAYPNRVTATDLSSRNGSTLNDIPMQAERSYTVEAGDKLTLAEMRVDIADITR